MLPIFTTGRVRKLSPAILTILLPLALVAVAPKPLFGQDSVVDASKKAKEQKTKEQGKPAPKVFTNESLGDLKGTVSVVGESPDVSAAPAAADDAAKAGTTPAAGDKTAAAGAAAGAAAKSDGSGEAAWKAKFTDARRVLSYDARELDILQREFNLKQQQYYSDPNQALREQYSRQDLDDTQAKIDAKKLAVDKDKAAIESLEDDLRKSGGDPGWAREDAPPPAPAQPPANGQAPNP